jgi:predicted DNA-binding transcriptional regulator AlpA
VVADDARSATTFLVTSTDPIFTATWMRMSWHCWTRLWLPAVSALRDRMTSVTNVVTAAEAARMLGLSESTLAKLRLNGNGPVYCKLGRRVVYRPADLEQWLQSRTTRDTSDADARFLKALTLAHPR